MDIEDIEDLISSDGYTEHERLQFDHVIARVKKVNHANGTNNQHFVNKKDYRKSLVKKEKKNESSIDQSLDDERNETNGIANHADSISYTPGQAIIYLKTWGCTHNDSDSQYMAGQLQAYGYTITNSEKDAQLWLLNSCTVKSPAEQHFRNYVENGLKIGKKIVVGGCVAQGAPNSKYLEGISIVGVQQIDRIVEVVEETLQGRIVRLLGVKKKGENKKKLVSLHLPKIRKNELIEIISINVGCLNQCTYCKTKHARGELASYSIKEITDRAIQSIKEGVKEIWITSEDTGAYGRDLEPDSNGIQPNIANLLSNVLNVLPSDCRLRLGMSNPPYIKEHIVEIAKLMQDDERIYKFLHIPVQSGSDVVLEDMKREYTIEEFQYIVDVMRERVPGITIATDLIIGFPTETEQDFEETVQLVERNKFPSLFINQFYPRPGTPAARMELIPANVVKKRTKKMTEIFRSYYPYADRIGKRYSVLVTELSSDRNFYVGHNEFYEQCLLEKRPEYLGKLIDVEIISSGKWFMMARPLSKNSKENSTDNNRLNTKLKDLLNFVSLSNHTTKLTIGTILIGMTIYYFKLK